MKRLCAVLIPAVLALLAQGCGGPSPETIEAALHSTNVVFHSHTAAPITLSEPQANSLKRIVARFQHRSGFRIAKDIAYPDAFFEFDGVRFGWLRSSISLHERGKNRYYIVEDPILKEMEKAFVQAMGSTLPLHSPSAQEWEKILSILK